jgi:hypothetical protein
MTLAGQSANARRCAVSTCANYTNHESGVCPRCREREQRIPAGRLGPACPAPTAPSPFDASLASRTTTGKAAATRTSKRERTEDEHAMQVELVSWCRTGEGFSLAPCLARIVAIPNGGSHSKMMNIRMWQEGRAKGFPDLFLPVPRGIYHGALLELKRLGEVPTAEQFEWLHSLDADGYATTWCDDASAAKAWLLRYAALPMPST